MRGALLLAGLLIGGTGVAVEVEIEPLDADFLEYLAYLEGDDADWTLLAEADQQPPAQPESKPAPETKPRKPNKEPAKPAAEER